MLGEEYGASDRRRRQPAAAGSIDPIDGTKSYVRGIPVWATLLALQDDGEVLASASSRRPRSGVGGGRSRGDGAFMRDGLGDGPRPLRVSAVRELGDAQLCYAGSRTGRTLGRLDAALALAGSCWRSRGLGDFWAYMLVAEGAIEIALDPVASLWDLAAPQVIVEEAGGRFSDLGGARTADGGDAIATNGPVHEAAMALVGR